MRIEQPWSRAAWIDLAHPGRRADVAGIDPQAGGAGLGRLDAALVVKVDVGDERHAAALAMVGEGGGGLLVRAGDADDVGARLLQLADLRDGRRGVGGDGVGHRLHGDRRVAAHRDGADVDLAAGAAIDRPPRAQAGVVLNGHDGP